MVEPVSCYSLLLSCIPLLSVCCPVGDSGISPQPASILSHLKFTSVHTDVKEMRDKKATGVDDVPGDVLTLLGEGVFGIVM